MSKTDFLIQVKLFFYLYLTSNTQNYQCSQIQKQKSNILTDVHLSNYMGNLHKEYANLDKKEHIYVYSIIYEQKLT